MKTLIELFGQKLSPEKLSQSDDKMKGKLLLKSNCEMKLEKVLCETNLSNITSRSKYHLGTAFKDNKKQAENLPIILLMSTNKSDTKNPFKLALRSKSQNKKPHVNTKRVRQSKISLMYNKLKLKKTTRYNAKSEKEIEHIHWSLNKP